MNSCGHAKDGRTDGFYSGDDRFGAAPFKNTVFQFGGDLPSDIGKGESVGFRGPELAKSGLSTLNNTLKFAVKSIFIKLKYVTN